MSENTFAKVETWAFQFRSFVIVTPSNENLEQLHKILSDIVLMANAFVVYYNTTLVFSAIEFTRFCSSQFEITLMSFNRELAIETLDKEASTIEMCLMMSSL